MSRDVPHYYYAGTAKALALAEQEYFHFVNNGPCDDPQEERPEQVRSGRSRVQEVIGGSFF